MPAALRRFASWNWLLVMRKLFCVLWCVLAVSRTATWTQSLVYFLQGKEIIEYYLRELEEDGVTHIPRWTPPLVSGSARLQLLPPSTARAIPVKGAKNGLDSRDPACPTELVVGTPEGRCLLTGRNYVLNSSQHTPQKCSNKVKICVSFILFLWYWLSFLSFFLELITQF